MISRSFIWKGLWYKKFIYIKILCYWKFVRFHFDWYFLFEKLNPFFCSPYGDTIFLQKYMSKVKVKWLKEIKAWTVDTTTRYGVHAYRLGQRKSGRLTWPAISTIIGGKFLFIFFQQSEWHSHFLCMDWFSRLTFRILLTPKYFYLWFLPQT